MRLTAEERCEIYLIAWELMEDGGMKDPFEALDIARKGVVPKKEIPENRLLEYLPEYAERIRQENALIWAASAADTTRVVRNAGWFFGVLAGATLAAVLLT